MLRNTTKSWGWFSRMLHWSMAAMLIGQIVLGKYAQGLHLSPAKLNLMMWHKSFGILLLFLALLRLLWACFNPRPEFGPGTPVNQRIAARLNHLGLYALMVTIPLSGWLMNSAKNVPLSLFRTVPWPALIDPNENQGDLFQWWHECLVSVMLTLLILHVSAALWHHFHKRDNVLLRMLGVEQNP
ncbi:MAG TPA: cytochrome b [Xanthomonadales bacterium]|nr:cytochrome b [Xanthomonadales bacterium]